MLTRTPVICEDSHRLDIEAADTAARIESEALLAAETFEPEPV